MFCPYCGSQSVDGAAFCVKCGKQLPNISNIQAPPTQPVNNIAGGTVTLGPKTIPPNNQANILFPTPQPVPVSRVGFSNAIKDPRFLSKKRTQGCITLISSIFIIPLPLIGFCAYSYFGKEMPMNEALKIGAGVSGIFLLFNLFFWLKKLFSSQWDGVVIGLVEEEHLSHRNYHSEGSTFTRRHDYYYLYVVKIQTDSGKIKRIENRTEKSYYFSYFKVGDRVRYHPDIDYYEKYDKTNDTHELCPFCNRVNPITADVCKCGAPIVK